MIVEMSLVRDTYDFETRRSDVARDAPQRYLTDGCRLFRVVTPFAIDEVDAHVFMSLEDCITLQVQSYSPQQLYAMGLCTVIAGAG